MPLENDVRAAGQGHRATNTQAIAAMRGVDREHRDLNNLIVLSSLRSCVSSSTSSSILVLKHLLSMSRRDRMPSRLCGGSSAFQVDR